MRFIIKMVLVVFVSLIILSSNAKAEAPTHSNIIEILTPQKYITMYAKKFGIKPNLLLKIAQCESQMNTQAKGDWKNGVYLSVGIYQYHKSTWNYFLELYKKKVYDENLNINSYQDQAKLTAFIFSEYPNYKKSWTTYKAYKNGGTYRFYSKLLRKHFTSVCK